MAVLLTEASYEVVNPSDLDYLMGSLRVHLGDLNSPYTYSDGFLRKALIDGFKALGKRWQRRYTIVASGYMVASGYDYGYYLVSRTSNYSFAEAEPPVILLEDERAVVLSASIAIKRGQLQNMAANLGSWKDDEISQSNIESGKAVQLSLTLDVDELEMLLPSRSRKLAKASKQSLPGFDFIHNFYEGTQDWN